MSEENTEPTKPKVPETAPQAVPAVITGDPEDTALAPIAPDPRYAVFARAPAIPVDVTPDFAAPRLRPIRPDGTTEDLLNGMIAELHFLMRGIALPSAVASQNDQARDLYLMRAMDLAKTGAKVGKSIAALRAAPAIAKAREGAIVQAVAKTVLAELK
ncbi:MAG TPA: hypothetical protein VG889_06765 [Rhizomicrobium sp.]|nr:hypothetical protein [Rhizomicrobium sp.]